jgi:hypothetical protein
MTEGQVWALLGVVMASVLASPTLLILYIRAEIGGLRHQMDAKFDTMDARFETMDARFAAMDQRFDHLDRDLQAIAKIVFPRQPE